MIVTDASTLITLSKIGRLGLLKEVYGEVVIGPVVKAEVVDKGKAVSAPGVEQVERAMEEGWIRMAKPNARERRMSQRLLRSTKLDEGEAEALALAQSRRLTLIIDDKEARTMAAILGIEYLGTAGVVMEAYIRGMISLEELEESVREVSKVMWLSPEVVADILKRAKEVRR